MIYVYFFITLWFVAVMFHAVGKARAKPQLMTVPDSITDPMERLSWKCLYLVARELRLRQPVRWFRVVPFEQFGRFKRGEVPKINTVCDLFKKQINVSSMDIMRDDPDGKFEKAARELAGELNMIEREIVGFADFDRVFVDFCATLYDPVSGVRLRLLRAYDMTRNEFVTYISALVVYKC